MTEHICECCSYKTNFKQNYNRHVRSKKHLNKVDGNKVDESKEIQKIEVKLKNIKKVDEVDEVDEIQKIKEMYENRIKEITLKYQNDINELKEQNEMLKDNIEMLNQEKEELQDEINYLKNDTSVKDYYEEKLNTLNIQIKEKDDTISKLNCDIADTIEMCEDNDNILLIKSLQREIVELEEKLRNDEPKKMQQNDNMDKPNIIMTIEPITKSKISKIQPIEHEMNDYLTQENFDNLRDDNNYLQNRIYELEDEVEQLKIRIANNEINNVNNVITDEPKKQTKKTKKTTETNNNNPIELFKELCSNPKHNKMIVNNTTIDKSDKNNLTTTKILKSIKIEDYQTQPKKLYKDILTSIFKEMKNEKINFITCCDKKRKIFKIYDGNKWNKFDKQELEKFVTHLIGYINQSLFKCIFNTKNLNEQEFSKIYKQSKENFLSCDGNYNSIILNLSSPMYNDDGDVDDVYMKSIIVMLSDLFKIEKKKSKKSKKSKQRDDDSDDESEDESDDESDYESEEED